jgi:hypothetical protein
MLIRGINYGSWSDDELRRALNADPEDVDAILECAERFRKQKNSDADEDEPHEFNVPMECPACGHEWDDVVDVNDYK